MADEKEAAPVTGPAGILKFLAQNRGIFFDILIFLANLFLMRILTRNFITLVARSDQNDYMAQIAMFLFCLGLFVLPPAAAILKRCGFHHRLKLQGKSIDSEKVSFAQGCLFNPIFFFCLNVVIISAINAFVMQIVSQRKEPGEALFVTLTFCGLGFAILQTYLVYRFFSPPKKEPGWKFLCSRPAENLGDLCAFTNILLFQVAWNALLGSMGWGAVTGPEDFLGRIFFLCFIALLLYFPPRILYLAEDIKKPAAWASILLANSPLIFRLLFGSHF